MSDSDRSGKFRDRFSTSDDENDTEQSAESGTGSDTVVADTATDDETAERDGTFTCDECGKEFDNERGLKSHTGQMHESVDDDEYVRLQLRVPRSTRDEFNGLAQSKLDIEMNRRGQGEMFDELSKPELQTAAVQVVVNNIDEWADEIEARFE